MLPTFCLQRPIYKAFDCWERGLNQFSAASSACYAHPPAVELRPIYAALYNRDHQKRSLSYGTPVRLRCALHRIRSVLELWHLVLGIVLALGPTLWPDLSVDQSFRRESRLPWRVFCSPDNLEGAQRGTPLSTLQPLKPICWSIFSPSVLFPFCKTPALVTVVSPTQTLFPFSVVRIPSQTRSSRQYPRYLKLDVSSPLRGG